MSIANTDRQEISGNFSMPHNCCKAMPCARQLKHIDATGPTAWVRYCGTTMTAGLLHHGPPATIMGGDSLQVYAVSDLLRKKKGTLKLTVYTLSGETVGTKTQAIVIPANTSTPIFHQSINQLLNGKQREDVVVCMNLTTTDGMAYQNNSFLCSQKDLRLLPTKPEIQVKATKEGCHITLHWLYPSTTKTAS